MCCSFKGNGQAWRCDCLKALVRAAQRFLAARAPRPVRPRSPRAPPASRVAHHKTVHIRLQASASPLYSTQCARAHTPHRTARRGLSGAPRGAPSYRRAASGRTHARTHTPGVHAALDAAAPPTHPSRRAPARARFTAHCRIHPCCQSSVRAGDDVMDRGRRKHGGGEVTPHTPCALRRPHPCAPVMMSYTVAAAKTRKRLPPM